MKKLYLANPYGFSTQQKAELLPSIVSAIESIGVEVLEPFARNNQVDFSRPGWARAIGLADVDDVRMSDGIADVEYSQDGIGTDGKCCYYDLEDETYWRHTPESLDAMEKAKSDADP